MNIENLKEKIINRISNLNKKEKTIIVVILSLLAILAGIILLQI